MIMQRNVDSDGRKTTTVWGVHLQAVVPLITILVGIASAAGGSLLWAQNLTNEQAVQRKSIAEIREQMTAADGRHDVAVTAAKERQIQIDAELARIANVQKEELARVERLESGNALPFTRINEELTRLRSDVASIGNKFQNVVDSLNIIARRFDLMEYKQNQLLEAVVPPRKQNSGETSRRGESAK